MWQIILFQQLDPAILTFFSPFRVSAEKKKMLRNVLLVLLFVGVALLVRADESNHQYQYGDLVQVYTAQIGPKHNPQETYHYYDFPFCPPKNVETSSITLGQAIQGFVFTKSNFDLRFKSFVFRTDFVFVFY